MDNQELVVASRLEGMFDVFRENMTIDIKEIKNDIRSIKQSIDSRVSIKEFDELKMKVTTLEHEVHSSERAFGVIASLKTHWRFIATLGFFTLLVGAFIYPIIHDIHLIALAHTLP